VDTLLAMWQVAQERSMVGPGDPRQHLERSFALAAAVEAPVERALDLGSGAGIPGLALAGLWPSSRWVLLDAANRRVELLRAAVAELGWSARVEVLHGRAEAVGRAPEHREAFDLVTSRSFGPPAVTAECGGSFVRVGGLLLVTEPPAVAGARWPAEPLAMLGLEPAGVVAGAQRLCRVAPLDPRYPRRVGVPAKRPLF